MNAPSGSASVANSIGISGIESGSGIRHGSEPFAR